MHERCDGVGECADILRTQRPEEALLIGTINSAVSPNPLRRTATIRTMLSRQFAPATRRSVRFGRTLLLWFAVLVALAQVVAIRHAYSHTPGEPSRQSGGKHPGGLAQCEACVAAAALGTAAPPAVPLLFAALARQLPQQFAPADQLIAPQPRPYAIRAPPASSS